MQSFLLSDNLLVCQVLMVFKLNNWKFLIQQYLKNQACDYISRAKQNFCEIYILCFIVTFRNPNSVACSWIPGAYELEANSTKNHICTRALGIIQYCYPAFKKQFHMVVSCGSAAGSGQRQETSNSFMTPYFIKAVAGTCCFSEQQYLVEACHCG